jgi:hypothetical protein
MKLLNTIEKTVKDFLIEKHQYDNLITLGKKEVNYIRSLNRDIDNQLNSLKNFFKDENFYFKGGVARLALQIYINKENANDYIRDADYVYIGKYNNLDNLTRDLAKDLENYNINWVAFLHEVEHIDTFKEYFTTRDLTMNEVLLRPDKLIFTRRAYKDIVDKQINPKALKIYTRLSPRLLLFACRYNFNIKDNIQLEFDDFNILVCLLKAYELNIEEKYFYMLKKYTNTPEHNLNEFLFNLLISISGFILAGREKNIIKDLINNENLEKLYDLYPEIEEEVKKINFNEKDIDFYLPLLRKPNRNKNYIN